MVSKATVNDMVKLSKSYNTKLNIKNTIFNHSVIEFSNEVTRKLFFQFSDIRAFINNNTPPLNLFHNASKTLNNSNLDNISPLIPHNNLPSDTNNIKTDSKELYANAENHNKQKSNNQNVSTPNNKSNSNISSINNKESLNTTININNYSINNDNVNKDRIIENIKELKLINEKNTDLLTINKSNNHIPLSPNIQSQTNYLAALNDVKNSERNENINNKINIKKTEKSSGIVESPKPTTGIDLEANKVKMQMKEQKEIESDSFDEIKEDDDDDSSENDNRNKKPKFVMNEMMSSLFRAVNSNNLNNSNNLSSIGSLADKQQKVVAVDKPKEVTENDMFEMLKSMGITKKEDTVEHTKNNEIERNNDKLNEIINKLPNLNYLTSKYVEIHDSIFNI